MEKITDIKNLLSTPPLQLFCILYPKIKADFKKTSNDFLTKPDMRKQLDTLGIYFFKGFQKIYTEKILGSKRAKNEIMERMDSIQDNDLISFSLFIGLTTYIERGIFGRLKEMGAFKYGNLTVTPKPANPIYNYINYKIRKPEDVGVNVNEFTDLFKKITVLEEIRPRISLLKPNSKLKNTNDYLRKRILKGFKISVSPFFADIKFKTDSLLHEWPKDNRTPFWFKEVSNFEAAEKTLFTLLENCITEEINILILPELTIDTSERPDTSKDSTEKENALRKADISLLNSMKKWLHKNNREKVLSGRNGLLMVIAGSFHIQKRGDIYNVSTVLNHCGDELWSQGKHQVYSITKEDILKYPKILETINISEEGGYEKIKPAERFLAVDTPIGRICVCICLDFIHQEDLEAFRRSGINLFFIPAMSPTNYQFREIAMLLGRNNLASSFIALYSFISKKSEETASFRYIPSRRNTYKYAVEPNDLLLSFEFK